MINFKFFLGLFPKTENIEATEASLTKEFEELEAYKNSEDLNRFLELQKFAESSELKQKEQEIKALEYKTSNEFKKETEYKLLEKSQRVKNYYSVLNSVLYKNYIEVKDSKDLAEYNELKAVVESAEFKKKVASIKALKYPGSEEFKIEQEFIKLQKSASVKNYFNVNSSELLKLYNQLNGSDELEKNSKFKQYFKFESSKEFKLYNETLKSGIIEKFEELEKTINSEDFKTKKQYLLLSADKKWQQTEEFKEAEAFKTLTNNQKLKDYLKFAISKEFKLFEEVEKTTEIAHYEELQAYINSAEFKEAKAYKSLPFKQKWQQTEEYAKVEEFNKLKKSDKVKWYFKVVNSHKFDAVKAWKLTFLENFEGTSLNKENWLTRFYYGDTLLHDTFSLSDDKHFITDGTNLKIDNSILKIETRRENATGKAWNPLAGFIPKDFEYTSGLVNTGKSFRQQYGKFQAKIKVGDNGAITHAFWLVGNQIMPQVDIMKYTNGKVLLSNFWGNITEKDGIHRSIHQHSNGKLKSGFFIYELEWTPQELIWRINGLELKRETNGIPSEPMYIQLSSGIYNDISNQTFPTTMEIDWVKVYEKV